MQMLKSILKSQYNASLEMMRRTIEACPDAIWTADAPNRFWHVAYHALFYAHLYSQPAEADFRPWARHRDDLQFLGPLPWPPHSLPEIGEPYSKAEVLAYLDECRAEVEKQVDGLDLEGESGFSWLEFSKLELQIYSIRHIQTHVGELSGRLLTEAGIEIDWAGTG